MKTITVDGKEYKIDCNALTYIKYKTFLKKGIMEDVQILQDYLVRQIVVTKEAEAKKLSNEERIAFVSNHMNKYVDDFIFAITRIAWILIYTADKDIIEYEKWLEGIKNFKINDDWIVEVAEFAVDCFC